MATFEDQVDALDRRDLRRETAATDAVADVWRRLWDDVDAEARRLWLQLVGPLDTEGDPIAVDGWRVATQRAALAALDGAAEALDAAMADAPRRVASSARRDVQRLLAAGDRDAVGR